MRRLRLPKVKLNWEFMEAAAGLGLLAIGIGIVSVPAALITVGALLLADVVIGTIKG